MKPYPIEFRQKILEVHEKENISIRSLAQRFCVAKSFVQKLLKQYKETGDIRPRPQGGSPKPKLQGEQLIDLVEIIETHNDATLEELCDLLEQKVQVRVSRATMGRITQRLNYSVKKNFLRRRKRK
jgi:transposase